MGTGRVGTWGPHRAGSLSSCGTCVQRLCACASGPPARQGEGRGGARTCGAGGRPGRGAPCSRARCRAGFRPRGGDMRGARTGGAGGRPGRGAPCSRARCRAGFRARGGDMRGGAHRRRRRAARKGARLAPGHDAVQDALRDHAHRRVVHLRKRHRHLHARQPLAMTPAQPSLGSLITSCPRPAR